MNFRDDPHLDVCQNIEFRLKGEYEKNPDLSDSKVINALENAKIAIKQQFGYAKNEKFISEDQTEGIIKLCKIIGVERVGKVNNLTLKEYLNRIDKIMRSVKRHSEYGRRAYYDFIKNYV